METRLLKISLERFQAGKILARNVFLDMPLNGRKIRLAAVGDEISADLLAKLRGRSVANLLVQLAEGEAGDPGSLPLYLAESAPAQAEESSAVVVTAPHAPEAPPVVVLAPTPVDAEPVTAIAAQPAAAVEESRVAAGPAEEPVKQVVKASIADEQSATLVTGAEEEQEEENTFSSEAGEAEAKQVVSGLRAALNNALHVQNADALATEESRSFKKDLEQCLESINGLSKAGAEEVMRLSAGKELSEALRGFNVGLDGGPLGAAPAPQAHKALREATQNFTRNLGKEKLTEGFTGTSQERFEKRFTQDENGEASSASTDNTSFVSRLSPDASSAEEKKSPQHFPAVTARAAVYKELPTTAGRMAAQLAHALGYAHPDYLSDLALGTILHFSGKKSGEIQPELRSPLIAAMLGTQDTPTDSIIEDSQEILFVLEAYFKNPECDRSLREFSQRLLIDTLEGLRFHPRGLNLWNEARWTQFVKKGPSLDAHSLCSRATAKAIKISKELSA